MKKVCTLILVAVLVVLVQAITTLSATVTPKSRVTLGVGGSFPIETFSKQVDVGYGVQLGYERILSNQVAVAVKWGYTNNSFKSGSEAATVNSGEGYFKYYFKSIALKKTSVVPYLLFSAGVTVVDNEVEDIDPQTVLGSAFGIGAFWDVNTDFGLFGEVKFDVVDKTKRMNLLGGVQLPFNTF